MKNFRQVNYTNSSKSVETINFFQDCNQDGVIDCMDYAAIHKLGGYGCNENFPLKIIQI